eukprot:TRINITY_DN97466_c0_g1_i1.p1 TRINITY_DN97466_c0_g1~~TRINITY_DN97466_c0_g1_i1.p1  ORF type:complete len:319 (+),score=60.80 TRINITY_DN97466_c0_g1_i1:59-1015(+)
MVVATVAGASLVAGAAVAALRYCRQSSGNEEPPALREKRRSSSGFTLVGRVSARPGDWDELPSKSDTHQLLKAEGSILKPLQPQDGNGLAEAAFYKEVQAFALARFCPKFHGCVTLDDSDLEYLEIEDLTFDCAAPAVMDLKMGTHKFYAVAAQKGCGDRYPAEKCARQAKQDAKRTSGSLGFLVSGIKVPAVGDRQELDYDGDFGKDARDMEAVRAVTEFIIHGTEGPKTREVASAFASELRSLLAWYQNEQTHIFYNCSLLFVYDAAPTAGAGNVKMRLIDFCHAWQRQPSEEDLSGVPVGLTSLLEIYEKLAVGC